MGNPSVTHDRIAIFFNGADILGHLPKETDKSKNNPIVISSAKTCVDHIRQTIANVTARF